MELTGEMVYGIGETVHIYIFMSKELLNVHLLVTESD